MTDHLKARLNSLKKHSDSIKRRADLYSTVGNIGDKNMARSLGAVQRAPSPGKKMQKIGVALVLAPEPVTTPIGIALMAAGTIFEKKYNGATIKDVHTETQSTFSSIRNFKDTVM